MIIHYPSKQLRRNSDRPVAIIDALVGTSPSRSFRTADIPLGLPITSARTPRGIWALYPNGSDVVVVHPGGALAGPPAEVAAELGRLLAQPGHGELDQQAARTIQRLLTGDGVHGDGGGMRPLGERVRTWSRLVAAPTGAGDQDRSAPPHVTREPAARPAA